MDIKKWAEFRLEVLKEKRVGVTSPVSIIAIDSRINEVELLLHVIDHG